MTPERAKELQKIIKTSVNWENDYTPAYLDAVGRNALDELVAAVSSEGLTDDERKMVASACLYMCDERLADLYNRDAIDFHVADIGAQAKWRLGMRALAKRFAPLNHPE